MIRWLSRLYFLLLQLMEESALVIIDFDKAIELGYVQLSKKLAELYGEEYGTE